VTRLPTRPPEAGMPVTVVPRSAVAPSTVSWRLPSVPRCRRAGEKEGEQARSARRPKKGRRTVSEKGRRTRTGAAEASEARARRATAEDDERMVMEVSEKVGGWVGERKGGEGVEVREGGWEVEGE
jgi:hypothetical protein